MKRIYWYVGLAVLLLVLCLGGKSLHQPGITYSQAKEMISEGLPDGSTREQVTTWLDARHIEHEDTEQPISPSKHSGLSARIRNADLDRVYPGDIWIFFEFDEDGRLVRRQLNQKIYGLGCGA